MENQGHGNTGGKPGGKGGEWVGELGEQLNLASTAALLRAFYASNDLHSSIMVCGVSLTGRVSRLV